MGRAAAWHRSESGAGAQHRVAVAGIMRGAWGYPGKNAVAQRDTQLGPGVTQSGWRDAVHAAQGPERSSCCRKSKQRRKEDMQRFRAPGPGAEGQHSSCSWEMLRLLWACPHVR